MRLLQRLGRQCRFGKFKIAAFVFEMIAGPRLENYFQPLFETRAAFFAGYAETLEMECDSAASDAHIQPPTRKNVSDRGFFRYSQRMMEGHENDTSAKAELTGPLGSGHRDVKRRRHNGE